jgi:hypothetical protein
MADTEETPLHVCFQALHTVDNWHVLERLPHVRGPFKMFVDSRYYSDSEFCGGAVTVFFSKYVPWQAMHLLQSSTHTSAAGRLPQDSGG